MAEIRTHTKPDAIWLFDYTSLAAMDDCPELMVWLSERDINIIWQSVLNIGRFRSRVFTDRDGQSYQIVNLDQWGEFLEWVSDMNVHIGDYPLCNELLSEIRDAIQAVADRECCPSGGGPGGGSAGAGLDSAEPSVQSTSEEAREGDPPAGFASWEVYDTYKCDMAYHIINQMKADIATAGLLAAGYAAAPALASALLAAIFTPIGWAVMIGLAGLAITWFLLGAEVALLVDFLEDNKDELACSLLDADNVAGSISGFGTAIDTLIPEDTEISALGSVAEYIAIQYLKSWASIDSVNRLYDKVAYAIATGNDCSTCGGEISAWTVVYGTTSSTSPDPEIIGEGVFETGYGCGADARHFGVSFAQAARVINFTVDGGIPSQCDGADIYYYYSDDNFTTLLSSGNTPPQESEAIGIRSMYVLWSSATHDDDIVLEQGPYS